MSPSDFGEILKPFVFLDLFDHEGAPFDGPLHPHSGIATLTYIAEGGVTFIDPDNHRGTLWAGGVEWMQAGRGMWHGGGLDKTGRTRGFQLWLALPPELESGPTISIYQAREDVPQEGLARVLLGSYGSATSAIATLRILVQPTLTGINMTAAGTALSFPSVAGLNYILEYKNSLNDLPWTTLPPPVPGTGSPLVLQDTNALSASRFYRVRCE